MFFSSTPLGSLIAHLPSTTHEHKCFCNKTPCVTCNLPPSPHVAEWHQVTTICAYVADGGATESGCPLVESDYHCIMKYE